MRRFYLKGFSFSSRALAQCVVLLFLFTVGSVLIAPPVFAQTESIARIDQFQGVVWVKSQENWTVVERVPVDLVSGDKVVTQEGRARVVWSDGGVVDVSPDSNVRITEKKESRGFFVRRLVVVRKVRVLLGQIAFNLTSKEGEKEHSLETPTVVAALRGTAGNLGVGLQGQTGGGLTQGNWVPSAPISPTLPVVLPAQARQAPVQQAAAQAVAAAQQAVQATQQAAQATQQAAAQAPTQQVAAAQQTAQAAGVQAQASLQAAREAQSEAVTMRDTAGAAAAQQA
ncbi:MAG: FecR domain-containing protein, partial [Candidatus Tectomicrobia bacterium]|nr:FecR domain-containing protein [Candidatus Tectomicrobia bacterium]